MSVSYSRAMLDWFQTYLKERFNQNFILEAHSNNTITLSKLGSCEYISFPSDATTFNRNDSGLAFAEWDAFSDGWQSASGTPLPAPGVSSLPTPLIITTKQGMHVAYDIVGLAYWMLSRQEEIGRFDLDQHGRFPATSSHAYKYGYLERPIVDEWLEILGQVIKRVWPFIELKKNSFSIKVSHDVDTPSLYAFKSWGMIGRMMASHLLKRGDFYSFFKAPLFKLTSRKEIDHRDVFNTFDWIMNLSDRHGLISAFYFICDHTDSHDAEYKLEDPRIRHLMRQIHQRGHEIGLHPSYGSYKKSKQIREEAEHLRRICSEEGIKQSIWGGRMHYLRWEQPTTLRAWADAGMDYDSTLGYADRPGFRCGTCFEYPAFDPLSQKSLALRIRPLIMMDCTVIDSKFLGLGVGDLAKKKVASLKNACRSVNGCFTLLWHNSELNDDSKKIMYAEIFSM